MAKQTYTVGQTLTAAQMTQLQADIYNPTVSVKTASYVLVVADVGTRIEMNVASGNTVTVNTSIFAAGDTLTISNKGSGQTTITAGTATVSSAGVLTLDQYANGELYFVSTGVAIWSGSTGAGGDLTAVSAGTGISVTSSTGPVPTVAIDTAVTADLTTAQTLTNKTLTAPVVNLAFNAQTGTTYTLVAADSSKLVSLSNAAGITLTLPISVYAAGEQINIIAVGAGQVTLAAASGAVIVSTGATSAAPKLRVQYSAATIICQTGGATPTFYVVGDLS